MVAGIDVDLFRADTELRRLARLAIEGEVDGLRRRAARPPRSTLSWAKATPAAKWLSELEAIKDPWFNMGTGDGLYHYYGSWHDDPSTSRTHR